MKIQFLGAAGTVTGSRYLLSNGSTKILIDCGLFQGFKNLRLKNWDQFPYSPSDLSAVLLTHAHLDHSGYLPLLVKQGFRGPIYCTEATRDLCSLLLPDSGYLQEEEAEFANRHGFSKHKPAFPLYTEKDAKHCLEFFKPIKWKEKYFIHSDKINLEHQKNTAFTFEFYPSGHLFGAASILIKSDHKSIAFSGDLGRPSDPITRNPEFVVGADMLVVESTYGNRVHPHEDTMEKIKDIVLKTIEKKGVLLIPSFAVGRAQLILYYLYQLRIAQKIPNIPIYLNSPMALSANDIYCRHFKESKMSSEDIKAICAIAKPIGSAEESAALNERKDSMIIIAASGMATGGRVLHHLKAFAPHSRNTILFVGFQAAGTRGETILHGAKEVKIHGQYWPIEAEIADLESMSAHADGDEIVQWIKNFRHQPNQIFVTHGEPAAADSLRKKIEINFSSRVTIPENNQIVNLDD